MLPDGFEHTLRWITTKHSHLTPVRWSSLTSVPPSLPQDIVHFRDELPNFKITHPSRKNQVWPISTTRNTLQPQTPPSSWLTYVWPTPWNTTRNLWSWYCPALEPVSNIFGWLSPHLNLHLNLRGGLDSHQLPWTRVQQPLVWILNTTFELSRHALFVFHLQFDPNLWFQYVVGRRLTRKNPVPKWPPFWSCLPDYFGQSTPPHVWDR